jgi:galactan endo-1,6-beta-galactosidase
MSTVIPLLRTELNSRGLTSTIIAASDEETYDIALTTLQTLTSGALADVARINVHGYQYGGGRRDLLYSAVHAAGKALWNSEYGEGDATGAQLASNLLLDFVWLHPTAWVYWQVLDVAGWGLITADDVAKTTGAPSQKYFVLAHFTRHIRPGMTIVGASAWSVAAYNAATQTLAIVAYNSGPAQTFEFSLSAFAKGGVSGALVPRWVTQIGSGSRYVAFSDTHLSGTEFSVAFAANEIMSFEVSGVVL